MKQMKQSEIYYLVSNHIFKLYDNSLLIIFTFNENFLKDSFTLTLLYSDDIFITCILFPLMTFL